MKSCVLSSKNNKKPFSMLPLRLTVVVSSLILCSIFQPFCLGIRSFPTTTTLTTTDYSPTPFRFSGAFSEAPEYRNGAGCPKQKSKTPFPSSSSCDPSLVHIAMTLDSGYLRGSIAAVHSVLRHSSCPENVFFHFISAEFDPTTPRVLTRLVASIFPSLNFKVYIFREDTVINLISSSIRLALENPLNYARNYLGDMLDTCVERVIYLDSDIVVVDDIFKLWSVKMGEKKVIGAPEYCHANFTKYFTDEFWSDPLLSKVFGARKACYFNTGVMVMDLVKWREGSYRRKIETWMELQKKRRIYELGSLPPFLLVFAGNVEAIDHRWNQHGLGGDNLNGVCRSLHPGPVSLLHWSGKGKPWVRLDEKKACPLDSLWEPYDLYKPRNNLMVHGGDGEKDQEIQNWSFSSSILVGYAHDLL